MLTQRPRGSLASSTGISRSARPRRTNLRASLIAIRVKPGLEGGFPLGFVQVIRLLEGFCWTTSSASLGRGIASRKRKHSALMALEEGFHQRPSSPLLAAATILLPQMN